VHWLLDAHEFVRAADWLLQMQDIFGPTDSPLIALRLRTLHATIRLAEGDLESLPQELAALRGDLRVQGL
jgi:hypothetical protein